VLQRMRREEHRTQLSLRTARKKGNGQDLRLRLARKEGRLYGCVGSDGVECESLGRQVE
jgi:hypothetical protein